MDRIPRCTLRVDLSFTSLLFVDVVVLLLSLSLSPSVRQELLRPLFLVRKQWDAHSSFGGAASSGGV